MVFNKIISLFSTLFQYISSFVRYIVSLFDNNDNHNDNHNDNDNDNHNVSSYKESLVNNPNKCILGKVVANKFQKMSNINSKFEKEIIGQSQKGNDIIAFRYSNSRYKKTIAIVANMHGNEIIGLYITNRFMQMIINEEYKPEYNIIIIPTINPDGFLSNQRYYSDEHDPNRNFYNNKTGTIETEMVKKYFRNCGNISFCVNLHGGALCVSYPMDTNANGNHYKESEHDKEYIRLAQIYTENNTDMVMRYGSNGGYINGADWYTIDGSFQDWLYLEQGVLNFTIEVSRVKNPLKSSYFYRKDTNGIIDKYWEQNKMAFIKLFESVSHKIN